MSEKLRIGFVGSGYMGQRAHMDSYATIAECEIVALAEGKEKQREMVARHYNIPQVFPDHRAMLAEAELDAVVASMQFDRHEYVIPDILAAGKHLFTEKPICIRPDTARRLVSMAAEKNLVYMIGYNKRYAPATQVAVKALRRWRETGEKGKPNYIRASMPPGNWTMEMEWPIRTGEPWPDYEGEHRESPPSWMDEEVGKEYISFINYFIHQVNLIRYLLGEDYSISYADPTETILVGHSDSGVPVILEMKNYGLRDHWEETYLIGFDKGKIDLSIPAPMQRQNGGEVVIFHGATRDEDPNKETYWEHPVVKGRWSMLQEARHFVACVRDGVECQSPAEIAIKDLEIAEEYIRTLAGARET